MSARADQTAVRLMLAYLGGAQALTQRLTTSVATGPADEARDVVVSMAAFMAAGMPPAPNGDFHRLTVQVARCDGTVGEGSAADLPADARVFCQMIVALANGELDTARALFTGFATDPHLTLHLLAVGLGMTAQRLASGSLVVDLGRIAGGHS